MNKAISLLTAATAVISSFAAPASALVLTYEGFGYTPGANITGQTGGTGWRTPPASFPWGTGGTTGTVDSAGLSYTAVNPSYTAFAPSGNAADMGGNFRNNRLLAIDALGVYDTAGLRATDGNYIGGSTVTGTLWGSYLVSSSIWDTASGSFMIYNLASTTGTGTQAQIRQNGAGGNLIISDGTGISIGTGSIVTSSLSTTNPNLIVFRYDFNGASNDALSVWLNPTSASDLADITSTQGNFVLNNLEIRSVNANGGLNFDELRYGTSFADVVPIPEPSAALLLAGGLGLLKLPRRR